MTSAALPMVDWFNEYTDHNVLILGDTHGQFDWMEHVVIPYAATARCHTIMQVGDFGFVWDNDIDVVNATLDRLNALLAGVNVSLLFLPGNHENHPMLAHLASEAARTSEGHYALRSHLFYTGRSAVWTWEGLRVAAVGGATSIDRHMRKPGVSWWPEEELSEEELQRALDFGPVDVLFTHDAPAGVPMKLIPDLVSAMHRTNMSHLGRMLKPSLWFHGHYHESFVYKFEHQAGYTTVRGLGCDHAANAADSMVALDLHAVLAQLNAGRYGGTEDAK